jgi:uncharacterized Fe-S cluster protein YjdI
MPKTTHKYTNGEVTIVWKPDTCIHSRICWSELREVFDPVKRPWINPEGSTTERIIEQVRKCPSGALSYFMNASENNNSDAVTGEAASMTRIEVSPDGPVLIHTDCTITHSNGVQEIRKGITALCRCGGSGNKPYCDGTHRKIGFKG